MALTACVKNDYEIDYQEGYPNYLADNWIAFEFQGGEIDMENIADDPYDLVTSLDPNRNGYLIIDKIYDADLRVRAEYADSAFSAEMGEQLERMSTNDYGIEYISVHGYVTSNPVLTSFVFDLAGAFFENMAFYESDIKDILFMRAGFYDSYQARLDTVIILGYRKTGFENVDY